ncbi:preprotein translocase subunit SecY [Candidatus Nomurabacteria bacterium RIFCSPHIGHO2_02_FULL_38_15]|uniref:Protein translocase subunit SecY n=1 Tax=Candidatus Nomurabacteria bacterium RIFCSPHIGHO2_02_FULL_38_15 TaxID=1801752 RepID=A0A1F6VRA9_9BACT|nr:MAG: preprotein translocase subunit SecY [Candidatus Nomurabacteria bacterium RIFCSPHIGHO2_02_FULL_38_15]
MNKFIQGLKTFFRDKNLRKRALFILGIMVVFRFLSTIPVPGVDQARLASFLAGNQFFGVLNIFSGGGLSTLSIIMLGVGPYITGSIIMQLITMMSPRMKSLYSEEGERGRVKFAQYSRLLAVPLSVIQGFALISILQTRGIIVIDGVFGYVLNLIVMTAGSMFLMWLGELLTEKGIGNGISFLIFAGIVAQIPNSISQLLFTYDQSQIFTLIAYVIIGIILVASVVFITEAERPIEVSYARQVRGQAISGGGSTYIPLRLNQAGVIPIIFALSIMMFPQLLVSVLQNVSVAWVGSIVDVINWFLQSTWAYATIYFILVVGFTYFYTAITFDPHQMANNLQKGGAFIPGIRPGQSTEVYLSKVVTRITLVGALFLGIIAVFPLIMQMITGTQALALGGTGLLIVVSVVLDIMKRVDAQLSMREY